MSSGDPEVKVTTCAVAALIADTCDPTFCLDMSLAFSFHFWDACNKTKKKIVYQIFAVDQITNAGVAYRDEFPEEDWYRSESQWRDMTLILKGSIHQTRARYDLNASINVSLEPGTTSPVYPGGDIRKAFLPTKIHIHVHQGTGFSP